MAFDLKKLMQPKVLIIGGIAVVGGLFMASKFRPKDKPVTEVVATPISQPYAVANTEGYSPSQGSATGGNSSGGTVTLPAPPTAPKPPTPVPQPPKAPLPPVLPRIPLPEQPRKPLPGIPLPGTPRREETPQPPSAPPVTANVPGGYPTDCRGVLPRPSDHPGANIAGLVVAKGNNARARSIALEWCVMGIASSGQTGLSRFTQWANNKVYWPLINQNRRNRGLKALTETQMQSMINALHQMNVVTQGKDDRLTTEQLQTLWATWHVPYLC